MAEKKGVGHAYNVDFLNVVFAASSLFLFLSVIWMVWDDFARDWKNTQRRFAQLEIQVTQANLQQAGRNVDRNKLEQLRASEAAARKNVSENQKKVDDLQSKLRDADNRLSRATTAQQTVKATYDEDRYDFESSRLADPNSSATARNCSRAASRFSTIPAAMSWGGGRLSVSPRLSSLSQKMSRFSLSRLDSSS